MTQHPLEFDPSRNEKEIDSLGDTWSRADALLEELPRARQRKDVRGSADDAQRPESQSEYANGDSPGNRISADVREPATR